MSRPKNEKPTVIANVRISQEARELLDSKIDKYKIGKYISRLVMTGEIDEEFKKK